MDSLDGSGNEVITGFRAALDIIDVPLSMASSFATIELGISPTPQGALDQTFSSTNAAARRNPCEPAHRRKFRVG